MAKASKSDTGTLIEVRLSGGRPLWCWQYLASHTYANFMVRTPSERCNERMLEVVRIEATRVFGDWPVRIIPPIRQPCQINYPRVRFTAFFTSSPMRDEMHLSSLVVVWFQDQQLPVPDESSRLALEALDWEQLAVDYET